MSSVKKRDYYTIYYYIDYYIIWRKRKKPANNWPLSFVLTCYGIIHSHYFLLYLRRRTGATCVGIMGITSWKLQNICLFPKELGILCTFCNRRATATSLQLIHLLHRKQGSALSTTSYVAQLLLFGGKRS